MSSPTTNLGLSSLKERHDPDWIPNLNDITFFRRVQASMYRYGYSSDQYRRALKVWSAMHEVYLKDYRNKVKPTALSGWELP